ncbi:MAG: hypothetical protein RI955_726 [Bacteroidota bacterium]|jgi:uncharacterized protein YdhG (YjbR/CyaY superfamily)
MKEVNNTNEYISLFPNEAKEMMETLRHTILKAVPDAEEVISYKMPAFKIHGRILVYFAAYKNHIGFYPGAAPIAAFQEEIAKYKSAKGSVQFPIGKPIPVGLVTKMTKFRLKENLAKLKK